MWTISLVKIVSELVYGFHEDYLIPNSKFVHSSINRKNCTHRFWGCPRVCLFRRQLFYPKIKTQALYVQTSQVQLIGTELTLKLGDGQTEIIPLTDLNGCQTTRNQPDTETISVNVRQNNSTCGSNRGTNYCTHYHNNTTQGVTFVNSLFTTSKSPYYHAVWFCYERKVDILWHVLQNLRIFHQHLLIKPENVIFIVTLW